jgi:hypothetical protein
MALAVAVLLYGTLMSVFLRGLGRHIAPAIPMLTVAPLIIIGRAWPYKLPSVPAALTLVTVLLAQTGLDRPGTVRDRLIAHFGGDEAPVFHTHGVTVITGDYWSVWPLTFATNLLYERRTGSRPVLPITLRSDVLLARGGSRVAAGTIVAVVPAGDLTYWRLHRELPRLTLLPGGEGYAFYAVQ